MTGILENHIIFMILESFLGTARSPLLAGGVYFVMIFTDCATSKQLPISLHLPITVFPCVSLEEAAETSFTQMSSFIVFLIQFNYGNPVMCTDKGREIFSRIHCLFHFSECFTQD